VNPLEATEEQMQHREKLEQDFEIGGVIVDEVLPYSLEYFLGIEHEGDEDFGDEEGDEEEGDEDDEEEAPKQKKSKSKGKDAKPAAPAGEKPECKNQ
jgi:nucleosome assembly protein 1-like 1